MSIVLLVNVTLTLSAGPGKRATTDSGVSTRMGRGVMLSSTPWASSNCWVQGPRPTSHDEVGAVVVTVDGGGGVGVGANTTTASMKAKNSPKRRAMYP